MNSGAVLIVPECERGKGGGHLGRAVFLFQALLERSRNVYLWIPENLKDDAVSRFPEFFETFHKAQVLDESGKPRLLSRREELSGRTWDFVVIDHFRTQAKEFAFWSALAPLVGIDEGGPCRKYFDFLIDILPSLKGRGEGAMAPNVTAPALLPLPRKRRPPVTLPASGELSAAGETSSAGDLSAPPLRVLISFGAEDAAGLGFAAARALSGTGPLTAASPLDITLIAPVPPPRDAHGGLWKRGNVRVIGKLPKLREHLAEYDLFVTHFGLGAFEAVYARLAVVLVSPTAYHEKLSRNAGFFSLGIGMKGIRRLAALNFRAGYGGSRGPLEEIRRRGEETARRFNLEKDQTDDLGSFTSALAPRVPRRCPVCEADITARAVPPVLARFPDETYRRCPDCGVIYLARLNAPPIEYEKDYFFGLYKKQYGKTYLEDFPNLMEMGLRRLEHIRALLDFPREEAGAAGTKTSRGDKPVPKENAAGDSKPALLDIGCAYGPFLAAAAERGFSPAGVEPAEDAARYVKEELGFPVRHGFFPEALPAAEIRRDETSNSETSREFFSPRSGGEEARASGEFIAGKFSAVTLWYVIEHFEETGKVLGEVNCLLKDGGVLAFSTPSYSGISGRKSLRAFLKNSPPDHWTIWSPSSCKRIFRRYGFRLEKIVVTGHHPERFPLLGRFVNPAKKNFLYRLLLRVSRLFRLGDTFEAYGVKRAAGKASLAG